MDRRVATLLAMTRMSSFEFITRRPGVCLSSRNDSRDASGCLRLPLLPQRATSSAAKSVSWLFRLAVASFTLSSAIAEIDPAYQIIAHRGGVVEDRFPDNSAPAIQAAIARGYWGIEIDIRETKDGVLVMRHDADLKLYYNDPRQLADLTWDEFNKLPSTVPGHRTLRFEDGVKTARDAGLWLMIDSKDPHSAEFCAKVEAILKQHDMLERSLIIGTRDALDHFLGKAPVGLKYRPLRTRVDADPTAKNHYFLFDHGTLTEEMVKWTQAQGITVIPSINVYHYYDAATMAGKSREELAPIILAAAQRDIEKLKGLGVTSFQIDSEFDHWFEAAER
jgi:glycerophosphoryl diester phosphodiesterase